MSDYCFFRITFPRCSHLILDTQAAYLQTQPANGQTQLADVHTQTVYEVSGEADGRTLRGAIVFPAAWPRVFRRSEEDSSAVGQDGQLHVALLVGF